MVVFGVLFANFVQRRIKQWRYGGWRLLHHPGEPLPEETARPMDEAAAERPLLERELSADTAQRILYDKSELDMYLKGRVSPFANVNCDLVTELDSGTSPVIVKDDAGRRITIYARAPKITLRMTDSGPAR